jgi:tRNA(Ile)-lysidine synthase
MLEEFRKYISSNKLFDKSERILLAVSGGIDSMVMTHLFLSYGSNIGIAHCNFQLRGQESDDDEGFIREYARINNINAFFQKFDTTGFAEEKGISIQMAARELRYRWFEETRERNRYSYIAVAHNLNDNVETFLINLSRGTGIAGLTGMKPKHKYIIRPLLFATRHAIEQYSEINNINFREDRSNAETKYKRNKIRHKIIPLFREINPSFETTITETAERLEEINIIITSYLEGIREKVSFPRGDEIVFRINLLENLVPLNTILYELFRPYDLSSDQVEDLRKLLKATTGSQLLTSGHRIIKNRRELIVLRNTETTGDTILINDLDELREHELCADAYIKSTGNDFKIPASPEIACLDAGKVSFPLIIRGWKFGDSFCPLGMRRKKKLSDYFTDNKYSLTDKENCFILESAGEIAWLINDRIDDRYKVTASTKEALIIRMKKKK